jgi:hypothetical protein
MHFYEQHLDIKTKIEGKSLKTVSFSKKYFISKSGFPKWLNEQDI